ncbi:hypothetical protein [Cohnella fermenti]|uniref:Uncharacterized protein n=1 Tax=Cohnella fermenti TaxID=2565925 RepID=A0A4S4C633_9BACL|nr:hypothetical protein [Cohnella fermenti]THF82713.1 hypothetical protein E6C55_06515 [Cohnella fermenti]
MRELYMNLNDPLPYVIALHYSRNVLNSAPSTEQEAIKMGWIKLKPSESVYHQLGIGNEGNLKYTSADGHLEAVYYSDGTLVRDITNVGTYNFSPPSDFALHAYNDVIPYYILGNASYDTTPGWTKFWVTLKAAALKASGN